MTDYFLSSATTLEPLLKQLELMVEYTETFQREVRTGAFTTTEEHAHDEFGNIIRTDTTYDYETTLKTFTTTEKHGVDNHDICVELVGWFENRYLVNIRTLDDYEIPDALKQYVVYPATPLTIWA